MSRLFRAAGLVSLAVLISRVLGLVRDAVRAALIGARWLSDAVDVAFKVPNLLRDLFAEGAFSGAFVPTLSAVREREGDAAAFALLNRVFSTMLIHVGAVVALLVAFAPEVVGLLAAPAFRQQPEFDLAVVLVRVLAPFLLFISLAVAAMGTLNVFGRFFVPALSPAMQNVVLVAGGMILVELALGRAAAVMPWALLLLAGGMVQFLVQLPMLVRAGWRPRFLPDVMLRRPETREIVRRMLPVAAGLAAAHVCILINTYLATRYEGGTSNLYYAFRLVHLPVGLVGVAVGTAVLAEASRRAARGDVAGVKRTLGEAVLGSLALSTPAAVGLFVLGDPIAKLLFLWGDMTVPEAEAIGVTIRYYSLAVVFYCTVKVVVPVFYAQGRMRVPMAASLAAVLTNLAVGLSLIDALEWRALALAVGCGQAANLAVLLRVAAKDYGRPGGEVAVRLGKIAVASAACGAAAWGAHRGLPGGLGPGARLLSTLGPTVAGGAAYAVAGVLLRSREIGSLLGLARRLDSGRDRP